MPIQQSDLQLYFEKLFPCKQFCSWLSYGQPSYFQRREFSFTLAGDIYVRFRSFENDKELQADLVKRKPEKIDIGGVYNVAPKHKDTTNVFQAIEKEICFDVDISDYDDVRSCCQDKSICENCWPLMSSAAKVLDQILQDDFGYNCLLFVFSGRRGMHCWACDRQARELTDDERSALISYVSIYEGGDTGRINIEYGLRSNCLHPTMEKLYKSVIQPGFANMFLNEKNTANNIHATKTATIVGTMIARHAKNWGTDTDSKVNRIFSSAKNCTEKWQALQTLLSTDKAFRCSWVLKLAEFTFMYPRLDVNVSKSRNHLLKAPFILHPGTGKVCIPLQLETIDDFRPEAVPTLTDCIAAYEKDDILLAPFIKQFDSFIQKCLLDSSTVTAA